jgi:hypothetical protein
VDYAAPVNGIRAKVEEMVKASPKWDGRVFNLAVTDLTHDSMQLRILASAADSGKVFELRCEIREKLIDWLRREHPGSLPRARAQPADQDPHRRGRRPDRRASD